MVRSKTRAWITYEEFVKVVEPLIRSDEAAALMSVADELSARRVVLHFKVHGCKFIKYVNVLIIYTPLTGLIRITRIETILSSELPAPSLFKGELSGDEVVSLSISKDAVSLILKTSIEEVTSLGLTRYLRKIVNFISSKLGLLCSESVKFHYEGFTVVE